MSASETYIQLGRAGDVLTMLPLMHERGFPAVVVAKEFAPILDGQDYCRPIVFEGKWDELRRAEHWAREQGLNAKTAQIHGIGYDHPQTAEGYQREMWKRCGYENRWEQRELCFNRRNPEREAKLLARIAEKYDLTRPVILFCSHGISCPFPHKKWMDAVLRTAFGETHALIDLTDPVTFGDRLYDLLGLYDAAEILVSCDTMHLHLSQASSVPVCAYVNSAPWVRSVRRANFRLYERYSAIGADPLGAAKRLIACIAKPHYAGKIAHTWASYPVHGETRRRCEVAQSSWKGVGWDHVPVLYRDDPTVKNSLTVDGPDGYVPQFKSLVDAAWSRTDADVLVFSNSDVGFAPGIDRALRHVLARSPAVFAYRWDAPHTILAPFSRAQTVSAWWLGGLDLFAFTRSWWAKNSPKLPDFYIGRSHWDLVFRDLVKMTGGAPLYGYVWHELHDSPWKLNPPSNRLNLSMAKKWFDTHDTTRPYP